MKVDTFVFKLIDHDKKCMHKICITILCKRALEWEQMDMMYETCHTMNNSHRAWATTRDEWMFATKETVINIVKKHYPHIVDFTLEKIEHRSECQKVNMSHTKGTMESPMKMKEIESMEKCICKYSKGKCPEPWTGIFNYECTFSDHVFEAKIGTSTDIKDPLLTIKPNGTVAILTLLACFGNKKSTEVAHTATQQGGADDLHKYLKYKHKYNKAKKNQKLI